MKSTITQKELIVRILLIHLLDVYSPCDNEFALTHRAGFSYTLFPKVRSLSNSRDETCFRNSGGNPLGLDAVIIADYDVRSLSGSSPLKLNLDDRTAFIQVVRNYLDHQGEVVSPIRGDGIDSWSASYKLNGIFLFSYLTKHGFETDWINNYAAERERFQGLLRQDPRAIVISTTFISGKRDFRALVEDIRSMAPDVFIIAGGTFVYMSYVIMKRFDEPIYQLEEMRKDYLFLSRDDPPVDLYVISLCGEKILVQALEELKKKGPPKNLPNTALFSQGRYVFTREVDDVSDAGDMVVDWDLIPQRVFESGVVPMQASTGCPNRCSFCNFTKDRRLLSVKPLNRLTAELNAVADRGARYVWFVDDNFRLGKMDLDLVCRQWADEGPQVQWMSFLRAETLKNVDLETLRRSGCHELQFGLESGDPQILKNMNKQLDPKYAEQVIQDLLALGINCSCYFIIGFPGETDESVARTIAFIKNLENPSLEGLLFWSIYPFMLAPMSPVFEAEIREKYELTGYLFNWKHRTMDSAQATDHVKKVFFELENSGSMYRGDNMEYLLDLPLSKRRQFVIKRHELAKKALQHKLEKNDVLQAFSRIFDPT